MVRTYEVTVGSFEGPFDLLAQLIARHKVDIYEVSLASITDDYLAALTQMEHFDLDITTEFLVIAATLVELKAARLLPTDEAEDLDDLALEARDILYARLLDYRTFKQAAGWLGARMDANLGFVPRAVRLEERYRALRPDVALPIDAQGLALLAARALAERPTPTVDLSHLQPVNMTVREAAGMVLDELERAGGSASFRELTAGCRHRSEVIVCFLAVLELYKHCRVDLDQLAQFGELRVTAGADDPIADGVLDAIEAYDARPADDGPTTTADSATAAQNATTTAAQIAAEIAADDD